MEFLNKTLGGLNKPYLYRQLFFGLAISGLALFLLHKSHATLTIFNIVAIIINGLLYPYARFVYEQVIGFIFGKNIFIVNAVFMFTTKMMTMFICWMLAVFIAPLGLLYLYYHHSKSANNPANQ